MWNRGNKSVKKYISNRIQDLKFLWQYLTFEYTKVCYENNISQLDKLLYLNFSKFEYLVDTYDPLTNVSETEKLYSWWKARDSREEPFEHYNGFIATLSDDKASKFYFSEIWKLENNNIYNEVQLHLKRSRELESKYFFEDKEMLHRVIDLMISYD
jgi:hypothetical protein